MQKKCFHACDHEKETSKVASRVCLSTLSTILVLFSPSSNFIEAGNKDFFYCIINSTYMYRIKSTFAKRNYSDSLYRISSKSGAVTRLIGYYCVNGLNAMYIKISFFRFSGQTQEACVMVVRMFFVSARNLLMGSGGRRAGSRSHHHRLLGIGHVMIAAVHGMVMVMPMMLVLIEITVMAFVQTFAFRVGPVLFH